MLRRCIGSAVRSMSAHARDASPAPRMAARDLPASRVLCLYHYPCHDGVFAALALHCHYSSRSIPVEFIPHKTFEVLDIEGLGIKGDDVVYLLDYTGPDGTAERLAAFSPKRVCILDHHKSAQAAMARPEVHAIDTLEIHFDMARSGAKMSWDYFQPQGLPGRVADLFAYVQDADLWAWKLPSSREFHAGLMALHWEYDPARNGGLWQALLDLDPRTVIARGAVAVQRQAERVAAALAACFSVRLGGAREGAAAALGLEPRGLALVLEPGDEEGARLRSTLGNELATAAGARPGHLPVAVIAYRESGMHTDRIKLSFRSKGAVDVSSLAAALGGGGHANAASAIIPTAEFESEWRG